MNFSHESIPVEPTPMPMPSPIPDSPRSFPPDIPTAVPATPTTQQLPPVVTGSYDGTTCILDVEPKVAVLGRDRPEATWIINSGPSGWHFYWHEIVNGKDGGDFYGGVTNKSSLREYPAIAAKYSRYAHIVIEQNHIVGTSHSDAVCTTNTVTFEIK